MYTKFLIVAAVVSASVWGFASHDQSLEEQSFGPPTALGSSNGSFVDDKIQPAETADQLLVEAQKKLCDRDYVAGFEIYNTLLQSEDDRVVGIAANALGLLYLEGNLPKIGVNREKAQYLFGMALDFGCKNAEINLERMHDLPS